MNPVSNLASSPSRRPLAAFALLLAVTALGLAAPPAARAGGSPPDGVTALFASSFTHEAAGENEAALNDTLAILRAAPDHYVATLRAGWLYYVLGRWDDSASLYLRARGLAPGALEPMLGHMLPLMASAQWSRAEELGRAVLALAPRDYTARSRLAWIMYSLERFKEAEAYYRGVVADYPSDLEMRMGLGWTLARQGRRELAREAFREVLSIRADHVKAREGLQSL